MVTTLQPGRGIDGPIGFSPNLSINLPLAQFVEVSAYWQATDRLALLGTFNWEDWSEADNLKVKIGPVTVNGTTGFQDTFKVGLGANYRIAENWLLQTGVMYDTSSFTNKDRTTAIPIDDQIRVAIGAQHDLSETLTLGLSFVYINLGQGEVRKPTVRGDYDRNHAFVFGLTLAFDRLPWSGKLTFPTGPNGAG